jgi:hypothetical protein
MLIFDHLPEVRMRISMLFLVLVLLGSSAQAQEAVAILKTVSGHVWVIRDDDRISATPGMELLEADLLGTDADGSAGVSFMDGSRVSLGPDSAMEISSFRFAPKDKDYAFQVYFKKGTAVYSSGKIGKLAPEAVRFRTPQAVLGIRGTTFLVRVQ